MKEPYEEGLANHLGPASCAGDGDIAGVAGTGVHAAQVLTSEITRRRKGDKSALSKTYLHQRIITFSVSALRTISRD